jgi:hypothetical protein
MTVDHHRFDAVMRTLTSLPTRRNILQGLASVGIGVSGLRTSDVAEATKKSKHKKRKGKKKKRTTPQPVVNQFGCLEVGQPCRGDSARCCSGICQGSAPTKKGKPDQSRCIAHGLGSCSQATPGACTATNPGALRCNNEPNCLCMRTTAGSNYCHDGTALGMGIDICANCAKDADCEALGYPAGSACAPISEGICSGTCPGGMACLVPCGLELPLAHE